MKKFKELSTQNGSTKKPTFIIRTTIELFADQKLLERKTNIYGTKSRKIGNEANDLLNKELEKIIEQFNKREIY